MKKDKKRELLISVPWKRALSLIEKWKQGIFYKFKDCSDLNSIEKILKISHKYEIEARKTAGCIPTYEATLVLMNMYTYIVYISRNSIEDKMLYNNYYLHLFILEAIRLLQYGVENKEEKLYSQDEMLLLLYQVEVMMTSREVAKYLESDFISEPDKIAFKDGKIEISEKDTEFIKSFFENFSGKGIRLRMADDITHFLMESYKNKKSFIEFLQSLLSGDVNEGYKKLVKDTYFEFLPIMKETDSEFENYTCFLKSFIKRIEFISSFMKIQDKKDGSFLNATSVDKVSIPNEMIYKPQFKRWKIEDEGKSALFNAPIVKIDNNCYVTCFAICGDSINAWFEQEINMDFEKYNWKQNFLQHIQIQFEEKVNSFMRKNGYDSGELKQDGKWLLEKGTEKIPVKISRQCDVFAVNEKSKKIFLLECKCLHDALSSGYEYKTIISNKKKILRTFIPILSNKKKELEKYIANKYPDFKLYVAIVTDIDFPIYISKDAEYKWESEILYCDFASLKRMVEQNIIPKNTLIRR